MAFFELIWPYTARYGHFVIECTKFFWRKGGLTVGAAPAQSVELPLEEYLARAPSDLAEPLRGCGRSAVVGVCEHGHLWAQPISCGREWCPVCGQDGSASHMRRMARWLPKVRQMVSVGYFVVTFPDRLLDSLDPARMAGIGRKVAAVMKRLGFSRGLRRWHFFGDKSRRWRPHLNVLVDAAFIPRDRLESIKEALRDAVGVPEAVINYSFKVGPRRILHLIRYVARATFRDWRWAPRKAQALRGFRNTSWWGQKEWHRPAVWDIPREELGELADLVAGRCPDCGTPIDWRYKGWAFGARMRFRGAWYAVEEYAMPFYRLRPEGGLGP